MLSSNLVFLLSFYASLCYAICNELNDKKEWDTIIFVQHWLPTNCRQFKEMDSSNVCVYPDKPDAWTVHGIWASGTNDNHPTYCNETWDLQPKDIESIQQELDNTWPDIFKETVNFWSYEWSRHGTCLVDLPSFGSPLNYFQRGLTWHKNYDLSSILERAGIVPSDNITYKADDISAAIESRLGKKPKLRCSWHDTKQHISELRLCFTKAAELKDCDLSSSSSLQRPQRAVEDSLSGKGYHTVLRPTKRCDHTTDLLYAFH